MRIMKFGSLGPSVQLLQTALNRWGRTLLQTDGVFGSATKAAVMEFQRESGITADGIVGSETASRLLPYYTGFFTYTLRQGDSFYTLSRRFGTAADAIITANPGLDPMRLPVGGRVTVPLGFDIVPTGIDCSSPLIAYCVQGIAARYPFVRVSRIGKSVMGRPLWAMTLGSGSNRVLYNASHHANEWITTTLLLKFTEELCKAFVSGGRIFSQTAAEVLDYATLFIVPAVNPDGIDLVTGELTDGPYYRQAVSIASAYPQYSFPSGWKANINGIDLNLQYPAGWEQARENKARLGIISPAPADYVGREPLSAPESRAMYDSTYSLDPRLTLSYHTQGEVIYWKYDGYEPYNSLNIAGTFSAASGYGVEDTPFASGFAGYKDWFISAFDRPGYTIEAGKGENPLPASDFDGIYNRNTGILTLGSLVT